MTAREKRIAGFLAVIIGALVLWRLGVPLLERTVLAVGRENEALREELDDLNAQMEGVEKPRSAYREYVARTGGTDAKKVRNALHSRLNELIKEAGLRDAKLSPKRTTPDRKTGVHPVEFSIGAEGSLESIVEFVEAYYELPYVARITLMKISPPGKRAGQRGRLAKFSATLRAIVLPAHPVGLIGDESKLQQPATHVKHREGETYALIWERKPFDEYVEPKESTRVVRDTGGNTTPTAPQEKVGDPDRDVKVIRMAMLYGVGEVYVVNTRSQASEYVAVGDRLDEGELLLVHPLGAVTRREKGDLLVYPVGKLLSESVALDEAKRFWPEIVYAYQAYAIRAEADAASEEKTDEGSAADPVKAEAVKDGAEEGVKLASKEKSESASEPKKADQTAEDEGTETGEEEATDEEPSAEPSKRDGDDDDSSD